MIGASRTDFFYGELPEYVKFAVIDSASSGNNEIIAAKTGTKFRVLSYALVSAGSVNTRFESSADGTALTGQMNFVANTGICCSHNPLGWFETKKGESLNLELSAAVSVDGHLTYIEVNDE